MNRRDFILGFGGISISAAGIMGTGAFTSVEAERALAVEVAGDNDAYLGLRQLGAGERSREDETPERVKFRFPSLVEHYDDPGLGLGKDSVYEFVFDAKEDDTPGLLRITNQGTNDVLAYSEHDSPSEIEIEIFDVTDPNRVTLRDEPAELSPGDHVDVGFRIATFDAQVDVHDETLTIVAEVPGA